MSVQGKTDCTSVGGSASYVCQTLMVIDGAQGRLPHMGHYGIWIILKLLKKEPGQKRTVVLLCLPESKK